MPEAAKFGKPGSEGLKPQLDIGNFRPRLKFSFGMLGSRCRKFKFETLLRKLLADCPHLFPTLAIPVLRSSTLGPFQPWWDCLQLFNLDQSVLERLVAIEEAFSLANEGAEMTH